MRESRRLPRDSGLAGAARSGTAAPIRRRSARLILDFAERRQERTRLRVFREPLLVRWPGVVQPGSVIGTPMSSPDFFPTLLEAADASPRPGQVLDGVSLVSLLKGGTLPERALFWHYPHYGNQVGAPSAAIRRGDWKLIEWFEDGRAELFNLPQNLGEQNDLAAQEPQRVAQLRSELHAWQKQVGAKFPTPNAAYDLAKPSGRAAGQRAFDPPLRP